MCLLFAVLRDLTLLLFFLVSLKISSSLLWEILSSLLTSKRVWRVRECIPHIGLIPRVFPLKLFSDMEQLFRGCYSCVAWTFQKMPLSLRWNGGNVDRNPFISFVNELDYSSTFIPQKHPRKERVTSAEELGTMSKNNLRGITLEIRFIWKIHFLTSFYLVTRHFLKKSSIFSIYSGWNLPCLVELL
mgnify:CR=1 FL=1